MVAATPLAGPEPKPKNVMAAECVVMARMDRIQVDRYIMWGVVQNVEDDCIDMARPDMIVVGVQKQSPIHIMIWDAVNPRLHF